MPRLLNLRAQREQAGLTQEELSELTGLTRPSISLIEGGRSARPKTQRLLAKALNCRPADLLGGDVADFRKALAEVGRTSATA